MPQKPLVSPTGKPIVVRPTFGNVGVEYWYRDQLNKVLRRSADDLTHALELVWRDAPPTIGFAHALAADAPSPTLTVQRIMTAWGKRWTARFDKLSLDLSTAFTSKAFRVTEVSMKQAFKAAGFTIEFRPSKRVLEGYRAVVAENVNLIKSVPAQYLKDIQTKVWQSVITGSDMEKLASGIREVYGVSERRAATIARDQTNKAKAVIENTRYKELGLTRARWQHSSAGRVPRPTHVAMNGKTYDLNKGMYDKDEGEWVFPGQLINCRCTSSPIIPGVDAINAKYGIDPNASVKGLVDVSAPATPAKRGGYTHEVRHVDSSGVEKSAGFSTSEALASKRAATNNSHIAPKAKAKGARYYVRPV